MTGTSTQGTISSDSSLAKAEVKSYVLPMLQPKTQSVKGKPSKSTPRYSPFHLLFGSSLLNTAAS